MVVRDMRGREIRVGDIVAYPGRKGSSMWMNMGEVVGFGSRPVLCGDEVAVRVNVNGRFVETQRLNRLVVVEPAVKDFEDKSHLFDRFPG